MPRPRARLRARSPAVISLVLLALERLYFERLDDPAAATSSIRRGGDTSYLAEDLRRLLPAMLAEGEGPTAGERVIEPAVGPIGFTRPALPPPAGAPEPCWARWISVLTACTLGGALEAWSDRREHLRSAQWRGLA